MSGDDGLPTLADAAAALVGSPFRLHGRDPATGLDCVGVVAAAMAATGRNADFPVGYSFKRRDVAGLEAVADQLGYREAAEPVAPNDVVLFRVGACQFHFAIALDDGALVHAHAGLRQVIRGTPPPDWQHCAHWRAADPA